MVGSFISGQVEGLKIRSSGIDDLVPVSRVLTEAAIWLAEEGMPLWDPVSFSVERLAPEVEGGKFWLFHHSGELAGLLKFERSDELYWPGFSHDDAAYLHKIVVCRRFAGSGLCQRMLDWSQSHALKLGLKFLRLDCQASRSKLRRLYESYCFVELDPVEVAGVQMARYQMMVTT